MKWHTYLLVYILCSALCTWLLRIVFSINWGRLLRVCLATGALSFFVDYPGEQMRIWTFEDNYDYLVLEVPLENIFLLIAAIPYIRLLFLTVQRLLRRRSAL